MRIPQGYVQKCKAAAHAVQAPLVFVAGCLTVAVLVKPGSTDARTKWYFALCFLTSPALLYLAMVPMWTRTVRFANAYVYAAVDILSAIFWFSAFVAVAAWNSAGIRQGAADAKLDASAGNCSTFAWGPEDKCNLSKATVGLGVIIFLSFLLTSALSVHLALRARAADPLPFGPNTYAADPTGPDAHAKDAWSADTAELDRSRSRSSSPYPNSGSALLRGSETETETETEEGRHPGRMLSWGARAAGTGGLVDGAVERMDGKAEAEAHRAGSALSPGGYDEELGMGRVAFPSGNYGFSSR
ncbi:hypothetical protein B0A49_09317 [Cryomyces minteri]|uniref:MARVEL domain-containing protein n=1 Tax=Cryomyces minteri TaxID=331657 RepID=A0A4U0WXZ6_9PEZI|nr:hypothetical protein B0A49_09317 [Cryomyces minteri]